MKIEFLIIIVFILLTGCTASNNFVNPKGVVCFDDGICETEDYTEANITNIKKCLNTTMPLIVKNYEGESVFVRGDGVSPTATDGEEKLLNVMLIYFNELISVYKEMYKNDISKELKELIMFDESFYTNEDEYLKTIFTSVNLSETKRFKPVQVNEGKNKGFAVCHYLNINTFLIKKLTPFMPKSFNDNIKTLLTETSKRVNLKLPQYQSEFVSKQFNDKVDIEFNYEQQYVKSPTDEEKLKVKNKYFESLKQDFMSFCKTSYTADITDVECHDEDYETITPFDVYELSRLPLLTYLDLTGTSVISIKKLKKLKNLQILRIFDDPNLKEDIELLKKENPNLIIILVKEGEEPVKLTRQQKLDLLINTIPQLTIENEEQTQWIQLFEERKWDDLINIFKEKNMILFLKAINFNKTYYEKFDNFLIGESVPEIESLLNTAFIINTKFIEIHRDYLNSIKFKINFNKIKVDAEQNKYENMCKIIDELKEIDGKNKDLIDFSKNLLLNANKLFTETVKIENKDHLKAYENYKTVLQMCPDKTLFNKVMQKIKFLEKKYKLK